ncbi:MAG: 2-amino-4-hydroxy-6-hydroxymethyldihydropteridine diphosphokinase [Candidatus Omnitrophota bacterium]
MAQVFLGVGSNIGNRLDNIKNAINLLKQAGVKIEKISKIIKTRPVGGPPQSDFLNAAIKAKTDLSPLSLLKALKKIEKDLGRRRTVRFGPRIIDLDILIYDNLKLKTKKLTIPHPRMWQRDFVLKPLSCLVSLNKLKGLTS